MKAAVVQMNSTRDGAANLAAAESLVRQSAGAGADLIVLPEKWPWLAAGEGVVEGAEEIDGPALSAASSWANELGIHLVAGSVTERRTDGTLSNTSVVFGPDGETLATYSKIHMFDVDVGGNSYRESDYETPGSETTSFGAGPIEVGLAICYDLRFPELFRHLVDRGVEVLSIPAAFTETTGRDHWEVLIRARAIENQCFVLAANQFGEAAPGYGFWGHSMIVDPWGEVLATVGEGEGFAVSDLDLERLEQVRSDLPALRHRRPTLFSKGGA
jgi:predicted amidohydrolase